MFARHTTLNLQFKFPAGTSRGVLLHKPSSFIILEKDGVKGIGECSTIPNLSIDPVETYSERLEDVCRLLNEGVDPGSIDLSLFPSMVPNACFLLHLRREKLVFLSMVWCGWAIKTLCKNKSVKRLQQVIIALS